MVFRHEQDRGGWIDLERPTPEEFANVVHEFGIGEHIAEELTAPSPIPLALAEGDAALLVLHFPTHDEEDATREQEIDIVAGRDFLLTVRYEVIAPLHALHKSLEAHELLGVAPKMSADDLLELVIGKIFDAERDHAKHIATRLVKAERDMFSGQERDTVRTISFINREFLHLEAAVADNEDPLAHFLDALERRSFYGPHFADRKTRILAERDHVARLVTTHRAVATELQSTNTALLNTRQNEIMKTLTIMAFVTFPLTLVSSIFGMNTKYLPIVGTPYDFWKVIAIMLVLAASFFIFFRYRRWL